MRISKCLNYKTKHTVNMQACNIKSWPISLQILEKFILHRMDDLIEQINTHCMVQESYMPLFVALPRSKYKITDYNDYVMY